MSIEHVVDQVRIRPMGARKQPNGNGRRYHMSVGKVSVYDVHTLQQSVWQDDSNHVAAKSGGLSVNQSGGLSDMAMTVIWPNMYETKRCNSHGDLPSTMASFRAVMKRAIIHKLYSTNGKNHKRMRIE